MSAGKVLTAAKVTITATLGNKQTSASIEVEPYVFSSFFVSPQTIYGGMNTNGVFQIGGRAVTGDNTVWLKSISAFMKVPTNIEIPAGQTGKSFTITSLPVSKSQVVTLTATLGPYTKTTTVTLDPYNINKFYVSPNPVVGGKNADGVVQLIGPAGPSGNSVTLKSSSPDLVVPNAVLVSAGDTGVSFVIKTAAIKATTTVTITATSYGKSTDTVVTINP